GAHPGGGALPDGAGKRPRIGGRPVAARQRAGRAGTERPGPLDFPGAARTPPGTMEQRMRRFFPAIALGLLVAACSGGGPNTPRSRGPVIVRTQELRAESVERVVEVTGPLAGMEEVTVSAEVDGRVVEVVADLGDEVRV